MEPISTLSLACNVLQLVEQAIGATRACKQIYERGSLENNDNVEELTNNVTRANQDLSTELSKSPSVRNMRLTQLAKEVTDTASELHKILNSIKFAKGQGQGINRAFKQTIRTLIKRGSIDRLEARLKNQETALRSGLIKAIYISCGRAEVRQSAAFAKLENGQQLIISKFLDGNSRLFNNIIGQIKASEMTIIANQTTSNRDMTQAVHEAKIAVIQQNLQRASQEARKRLLDSLYFDTLNQRQDFIETRIGDFGETFRWIFSDNANHGFSDWLGKGTGIFWVNGLAGSGKSSLMAFIHRHLQSTGDAARILQRWAELKVVRVLSFFFYKPSSDELLNHFSGFWRSMCYQLLSQDESLFELVLANDHGPACLKSVLISELARARLTNQDLKEAFFFLLQYAAQAAHYFILIDGLDEFMDSQEQLVTVLEQVAKIGDTVKICCSSRPEPLYQRRLHVYPSLRLQDLTRVDMRDLCVRQLGDTPASSLIEDIIHKAQGVFLWLHLVVNDLKVASAHDNLEELKERLHECPSGMKGLFSLMLKRCDPFYIKRPKAYLRLVYTASAQNAHLTLLDLALYEVSTEQLMSSLSKTLDHAFLSQLDHCLKGLESQVTARTAGLVQFHDSRLLGRLSRRIRFSSFRLAANRLASFIHRTAMDFLSEETDGQNMLHACCMSEQEVRLTILRAFVACAILCEYDFSESDYWIRVFRYAGALEKLAESHMQYFELLDVLFHNFCAAVPECRLEVREFAVFALKRFELYNISPAMSVFHNMSIGIAATFGLVYYGCRKISELPSCERGDAVALFLMVSNMSHLYIDFESFNRRPQDHAWGILKGFVLPLISSKQAVRLIHGGRNLTNRPWYLVETTAPLRNHIMGTNIASTNVFYAPIAHMEASRKRRLHITTFLEESDSPDCSEMSLQLVYDLQDIDLDLVTWHVGEVLWSANQSEYFVVRFLFNQKFPVNYHPPQTDEIGPRSSGPRCVSLSPPGIEKFFDLTADEADTMTQRMQKGLNFKTFDEVFVDKGKALRLAERLLNANLASLSEEDVQELKSAGWSLKDDKFDGMGAFGAVFYDNKSDDNNAGITLHESHTE